MRALVLVSCLAWAGCSRTILLTPDVVKAYGLDSGAQLGSVQLYLSEEFVLHALEGTEALSIKDHKLNRQPAAPEQLHFKAGLRGQGALQADKTLHVRFDPAGGYLVFRPPRPPSAEGYELATRFDKGNFLVVYSGRIWVLEGDVSRISLLVEENLGKSDEPHRTVPGVDLTASKKPDGGS